MEDLNEKYEKVVATAMDDFMELKPGDDHYIESGKLVETLYGRYLEEERQSDERSNKQFERSLEEDRLDKEAKNEELAHKVDAILKGAEVLKLVIFLTANMMDQKRIMNFEKTGVIRTLAFQRTPKINIKP